MCSSFLRQRLNGNHIHLNSAKHCDSLSKNVYDSEAEPGCFEPGDTIHSSPSCLFSLL